MSGLTKDDSNRTLIDQLIEEQQLLTAVARFAQKHENHELPLQERYYRSLIPLEKPGQGQQYAFEVDLDKCSACKACVTACHSLNGLGEKETWRSVGLLHGNTKSRSVQLSVTTACHHCVEPGCLLGCPVLAYDKDPLTGIVRHLDDQCIGCQYCVLKCPYDVPKYSNRLGIVRKCDMCHNRLTSGEAPACVQACPNEAIKITIIDKERVSERFRSNTTEENSFLPSSPDPSYTLPTTIYRSTHLREQKLEAADQNVIHPEHPHWALVFMLVLTQLSVGMLMGDAIKLSIAKPGFSSINWMGIVASIIGLAGLVISIFHLGKPSKAWRVFLGLKHSWLSREAVVFGAFGSLLALYLTISTSLDWKLISSLRAQSGLILGSTVITGFAGVFCSVMLYHDTKRTYWNWKRTGLKFFGASVILGANFSMVFVRESWVQWFGLLGAFVCLVRLTADLRLFGKQKHGGNDPLGRSALIILGPLRQLAFVRYSAVLLGIVGACTLVLWPEMPNSVNLQMAVALALLTSELCDRSLYFQAASEPKMPGGLR